MYCSRLKKETLTAGQRWFRQRQQVLLFPFLLIYIHFLMVVICMYVCMYIYVCVCVRAYASMQVCKYALHPSLHPPPLFRSQPFLLRHAINEKLKKRRRGERSSRLLYLFLIPSLVVGKGERGGRSCPTLFVREDASLSPCNRGLRPLSLAAIQSTELSHAPWGDCWRRVSFLLFPLYNHFWPIGLGYKPGEQREWSAALSSWFCSRRTTTKKC